MIASARPMGPYIQAYNTALQVWREPSAPGRRVEEFSQALEVLLQAHGVDDVLLGQAVCQDFSFESTLAINMVGQCQDHAPVVRHALFQALFDHGCNPNHRVGVGKTSAFEFLVLCMHSHAVLREDVVLMEKFLAANSDYAQAAAERPSPQQFIEQSQLSADFAHSPAIACLRSVIRARQLHAAWPPVRGAEEVHRL